jgi:hypothetical protein
MESQNAGVEQTVILPSSTEGHCDKPGRIFVMACPTATNTLKEVFIARYPNGKVSPT